jgi:hypothetical protein
MESNDAQPDLSSKERKVLKIFREYLMTPGDMLCFCGKALDDHRTALGQLRDRGYLKAERLKGAFSLTREGCMVMRRSNLSPRPAKRRPGAPALAS